MPRQILHLLLLAAITIILPACGSGGNDDDDDELAPFAELIELGLDEYVDDYTPSETTTEGELVTYHFDPADGPMCLRGAPFSMSTIDRGSDELLIFLQGGGACFTGLCMATEDVSLGYNETGILNTSLAANPVADWSVAYFPYCDGSLFTGDTEIDEDGDGEPDRFHYGLRNLSAGLAQTKLDFPAPTRILLTGTSAGSYGTIIAAMLTRLVYPGVPIDVIQDAGVGIGKTADPDFVPGLLEEWGVTRLIPPSCEDCLGNGHVTRLIDWGLTRDENLRISAISSYGDFVIGGLFLFLSEEEYKEALLTETGWIAEAHPETYNRFFFEGKLHTTIGMDSSIDISGGIPEGSGFPALGGMEIDEIVAFFDETAVNGVTVAEWVGYMVNRDERWDDLLE